MTARSRPTRTAAVLAILLVSYIFNFLDRQVVGILAIPIKADLKLSDTQLGLLGGIAFAALYSTLAIPIARVADGTSRARVITLAITVWSGFTALCGLAGGFGQLFLARMGVSIGEAGGVAPAYALIAENFPPRQRSRALAIFSLGIPVGSALGLFFGGWLAQNFSWRTAFIVIGLCGLPVALLTARVLPPNRGPDHGREADRPESLAATIASLARKPAFWLLALGSASASICGYGYAFWLPRYLNAGLGLSLSQVGSYFGAIVLVGGITGIFGGGWMADRLAQRRGLAGYPTIPGIAFILAAPLFLASLLATSLPLVWLLYTAAYALSQTWLGPNATAVQHLVEPRRRATASATFLLVNNLIGIGFGTFIFGFLSDRWAGWLGAGALHAALLAGTSCYVVAGLLCLLAARRIVTEAES